MKPLLKLRTITVTVTATLALCGSGLVRAQSGETVRIALLEPSTGAFANVGQNIINTFRYHVDRTNKGNLAGVKFEVTPFDSKTSPQEALSVLKSIEDKGYRYVAQGLSSAVASALADAIAKYNERNPGKEIVYFNYASQDPALNNEQCGFWHFNIDSDTSMKVEAMGAYIEQLKDVKKVYLIGQNYSHGQQFSRFSKEVLARRRPDVQIVGDDLHPIGMVKDFAPYVEKIRASGADTVMTGNWGPDITLLAKAINTYGLKVRLFAPLAQGVGVATALAASGDGLVHGAYVGAPNLGGDFGAVTRQFHDKYSEYYGMGMVYNLFQILPAAMAKAKSTDPIKVAYALEGLSTPSFNGDITMRKSDHRLQQGIYMTSFQKVDAKNPYDVEGSGHTWVVDKFIAPYVASTPTSCQMKRPG